MPTKLEIIYNKINNIVCEIYKDNDYTNMSEAFGHFYIQNLFNIDDQKASESITDGYHDKGIDAIFISEDKDPIIHFFQFKYPDKYSNISAGIKDNEINSLRTGVRDFLTSKKLESKVWNDSLIEKHNEISRLCSYNVKLWIVKYTNANLDIQRSTLKIAAQDIHQNILNPCTYDVCGAEHIAELYESRYENIYPDITLTSLNNAGYQIFKGDNFTSINIICTIKNLYDAVSFERDSIFDGNVRYYNSKTDVTEGIRTTLKQCPEHLILFNNGVTILSKKVNHNAPITYTLKGASIINGAQTMGSILDVLDESEDFKKYENAPILVRILEIDNDEEMINNIVNSLNTQTKMFSAFNISKDSRLKNIQNEINNDDTTPYFIEIKYNEYNTQKAKNKTKKLKKDVISSEKLIQLYTAYNNTLDKASIAKAKSSDLLKEIKLLENILDSLTKKELVKILEIYDKIREIIKKYRAYKKKDSKDIIKYLGITEDNIHNYHFLTTADILLLYVTGIIIRKYPEKSGDECIKLAIQNTSNYIEAISEEDKIVLSNITKSKRTFNEIKAQIYKDADVPVNIKNN